MVEYTAINALTFFVGLVFLYNGYRIVASGREDIALFVTSAAIGLGLLFVAIFPYVFDVIATLLGIEFKTNAILIISNLTLFILVTYLFSRIGSLYDNISRLNEEVSLLRTDTIEREKDSEDYD
jgi:hypothetical protein